MPGFHRIHESGAQAAALRMRSALLGALLGMLLAVAGLQRERHALEPLQAREQQLRAQLQQVQQALKRASEAAARLQAAQDERERAQAARRHIDRVVSILESLAEPTALRLSLLRWDAQGWTLQGHADPAHLQDWVTARARDALGQRPAQLTELSVQAGRTRFVLRWPGNSEAIKASASPQAGKPEAGPPSAAPKP